VTVPLVAGSAADGDPTNGSARREPRRAVVRWAGFRPGAPRRNLLLVLAYLLLVAAAWRLAGLF
jgi:hypothetical protein